MAEKKKIFVSHSSKDEKVVNDILELLRQLNISYWKAPEMIPVGSNYAREIPRAIKECEIFLLVLSEASQVSIWIEKEIDMAINCRKTIVPVKIDPAPLNDLYSFYLNNVQAISYSGNTDKGKRMLKERLFKLLPMEDVKEDKQEQLQKQEQSPKQEQPKKPKRQEGEIFGKETDRRVTKRRADVFSKNPSPSHCQFCGGELKEIGIGTYECLACGKENYDYLRRVRNFLEENGACSAVLISQETGVPRDSVEYFLREEFLEIPKYASGRISCMKCGAPIRTGKLCDKCKEIENRQKIQLDTSRKGAWHSAQKR
ncbi:MAG: toll/interleukin-1 receptor domain-containing protein [Ruminococcus flavefaciens]|nr:toll/interleukin-1 receptor domain-containing protein [Ruminococcus flavefaciens]